METGTRRNEDDIGSTEDRNESYCVPIQSQIISHSTLVALASRQLKGMSFNRGVRATSHVTILEIPFKERYVNVQPMGPIGRRW